MNDKIEIVIKNVEEGYMLYIGTPYSSGYKKLCKNRQELNDEIQDYVNNYQFVVENEE